MNTADFLSLLRQSRLLSEEQMAAAERAGGQKTDVEALARDLIRRGWLTPWQARKLLSGRVAFFFNKYRLLDCLGRGGMGVVYKAHQPFLDRTVAIKVILDKSLADPEHMARFRREMRSVAALSHPNIIAAHDADVAGKNPFLVMEYVEGRGLDCRIKEKGPLPIDWSCECIRQAALGLQHAFQRGLVHRDIKPSNLLVVEAGSDADPVLKILDFGLAQFRGHDRASDDLTRTGQVMGTIDYIAPEQAKSTKDADIRSDIFSLGCTLFEMVAGVVPYQGDSLTVRLAARFLEDAPPLSRFRKDLPQGLEGIVGKMLQRDPNRRHQTPLEVAEALHVFTRLGRQEKARRDARPRALESTQSFSGSAHGDARPKDLPKRGQLNDQLGSFYRGVGIAEAGIACCAACGLMIPGSPPPLGTVGVNILLALQNTPQSVISFTVAMKGLLGERYVAMPADATGMMSFLNQFVAVTCGGCARALCPACREGHPATHGCILCGHTTAAPRLAAVSGPLGGTIEKVHAATIAAMIGKLDSASDAEFRNAQQVVLGSAVKMAQDARSGGEVQFLGLALRAFCDAVESKANRPVDRGVIRQIRAHVDQALPQGIDPRVQAEFQQGMRHIR